MHALRKTNQDLVFVDSTIWLAVLLFGISLLIAYRSYIVGSRGGFVAVVFLLLCAFLFWRREMVTFDAGGQRAEWTRRRAFKIASGTVPFSEITGIGMETTASGSHGELSYRLTILTRDKPVPMSDVYYGNQGHYESIRQEILGFLHLDSSAAKPGESAAQCGGIDDEPSVISLLKQGRRIDAIELVRSMQKLSLTEATNRVAALLEKMKVTQ
jgi:hypothetical protein